MPKRENALFLDSILWLLQPASVQRSTSIEILTMVFVI